jgi:cyanophycinase
MGEKVRGNLIIIGGAEDKANDCIILKEVAKISGGENARLSILTTATEIPKEVGNEYKEIFRRLGIRDISVIYIASREDANNENYAKKIRNSSGIFFTGGDQLRITSIIGGTIVDEALHDVYKNGILIAGTSAGASVMSSTMIVEGKDNDPARKCTLKMAPGLGFFEEAIIDQHFAQRGRIGRLLCGIAENPYMLGIGIDEDTAIRVFPDGFFEVIGSNSVTILDGRKIRESNVSETDPDALLLITNVILHVIPKGYGFNMKSRTVEKNSTSIPEKV